MRRRISERLSAAAAIPTVTVVEECDLTAVAGLTGPGAFDAVIVKVVAEALADHPRMNASVEDGDLVLHERRDIGAAVQGKYGLVVPVVRGAGDLGVDEIEAELNRLADAARTGTLMPRELAGGTFSVTNAGSFGGIFATPILNPPQVGILGLHRPGPRPVVRGGEVVVRPMANVSLTFDHRVLDGHDSSAFLIDVVDRLQRYGSATDSHATRIREIAAGERPRFLLDFVRETVAALIEADDPDPNALAADARFLELGLDSLKAIELRNRLVEATGLILPVKLALEHPTPAELVAYLERELENPVELVDQLPRVKPRPQARHEPFPLTDIQRAYLVGRSDAFVLGGVATHAYFEVESAGLDVPRLSAALRRLIDRHEMLRAVFAEDGSQRVLEGVAPYEIAETDLRAAPEAEVAATLHAMRERLSHEVRPAGEWPLFEFRASRLPGDRVLLHVSFDLLIADLWSLDVFLSELGRLYDDPDAVLPGFELSFRDYVLAEARLEGHPLHERAKAYWRERVPTLPPGPDLPLTRAATALARPRFGRRAARVDADRWTRIKKRAAAAGLTPTAVLVTAFGEALAAWTRKPHFTLSLTLSNRLPLHPDVDKVIGDFTSVELLEVDLREGDGLGERAWAVQDQLWRDLEHQYWSGVRVRRELAQAHETGVLVAPVVFTSGLGAQLRWPGRVVHAVSQTPQVLLDHQVFEEDGELVIQWDAVEEAYPAGVLDGMFEAYVGFVGAIGSVEGLWTGSEHYDWLTSGDRETRERVNATAGPLPDELLQDGFYARAVDAPEAVALGWSDGTMTYAELAGRVNALAHALRPHVPEPGALVGVSVHDRAQQVIAVLAVLEAGGAYVPVDPELPDERRHRLVEQAGTGVVVTAPPCEATWPERVHEVAVDAGERDDRVAAAGTASDDLAYVLYTSGSTGVPKGVAITHRAACNTLADINDRFDVGASDAVLALSSLSFDLSVYDVFGVLGAGGTVVLPDTGTSRDPRHWLELCERHGVTIWNSVPALMEIAVEQSAVGPALPPSLRLVMMSGDWIPVSLPERIRAIVSAAKVVSLGGATEAAIWSIAYEIGAVDPAWESIPYGYPLRNQTFAVLNDRLDPCPAGVTGELYIGGAGLAREYWRDPERTAASFVSHPRTGERLYRTGDLGRYRADGAIEFLGREDTQVKIGGFRIELGEIEAGLTAHPGVRDAAVAAEGADRSHRQLVAYYVPRPRHASGANGAAFAGSNGGNGSGDAAPIDVLEEDAAVVTAPADRLAFKLARHALRTDLGASARALPVSGASPARSSRASQRSFDPAAVPRATLAALLELLRSDDGAVLPKYLYGSAGGLYPVQAYVAVERVEGLERGVHYYDPRAHALARVSAAAALRPELHYPVNRELVRGGAFGIFLAAPLDAIAPLYGEGPARRLCLIEAGLIAQLLETEAPALGLGLCQVALRDGDEIRDALDIDDHHLVLHGLVGGLIAPNGGASLEGELRAWLGQKLPGYMLPQRFVPLRDLPLTPTGKVDRKALSRAPRATQAAPEPAAPAPLELTPTAMAERVRAEVAASLDPPADPRSVRMDASFFDLGFDSLRGIQLRNRLQQLTDAELPAALVFDHPTPAAVADYLAGLSAGDPIAAAPGAPVARVAAADGAPDDDLAAASAEDLFELIDDELRRGRGETP